MIGDLGIQYLGLKELMDLGFRNWDLGSLYLNLGVWDLEFRDLGDIGAWLGYI